MNKLFVYGIFLDEKNRQRYGMSNPRYATVKDYATWGNYIVTAKHQSGAGLALTGLLVDIEPEAWPRLDALEAGYDREEVDVLGLGKAYMYVGKDFDEVKR